MLQPTLLFPLLAMLVLLLTSCAGVKDGPPDSYNRSWNEIDDAVPRDLPFSKYGNPSSYEVFGKKYFVRKDNSNFTQTGLASWYGSKFHGKRTSSGEPYDMYAMTAAHKSLRIPVYVEVTNTKNGRKAIVKVNDRGPFHEGRIIDLSYAAATKLGVAAAGTAPVSIRVVSAGEAEKAAVSKNTSLPAGVATSAIQSDVITATALTASSSAAVMKQGEVLPVSSSTESVVDGSVKTVDGRETTQLASINPAYTFEGGKVYVQVAAFGSESNALAMLGKLKQEGFNSSRIHVENESGKLMYRVRIGPLPTEDVAEKLVAQLKEVNRHNVTIITYN